MSSDAVELTLSKKQLMYGVIGIILIAVAGVGWYVYEESQDTQIYFTHLSPYEFKELMQNPEVVVIDVRTPEEYAQGHLEGAINIDYYAPNFRDELNKLDKDKLYLIYCRTGHRSGEALKIMKSLGFERVYDLEGGITNWIAQGYEVVK